ncbi:MAG: phospholipid carrier-dependent glycosyltransferase [Acidimicrobiales bacterium]
MASTASRAVWLGQPATLVGDEVFYVNAARHIASIPPGADDAYALEPLGLDPNFEHPPLAKVIMAGSMRLLGNTAVGWRLPSVIFGTLAVALIYWLARGAGAGPWESVGAAALMAADNMTLAYGRFATLDIFVVVFMMLGVGLYLRGHPWWAGAVLGLGATAKLVGLAAVVVLAVMEMLRRAQRRRGLAPDRPAGSSASSSSSSSGAEVLGRLAACALVSAVTYLVVLGTLDQAVTRFDDPVTHTRQMLNYAERTTFALEAQSRGTWTQGTLAPVSRPWEWILNRGAFGLYHKEAAPPGQPGSERQLAKFESRITPAIVWLALPALLLAALRSWSRGDDVSNLVVAWFAAVFGLLVAVVLRDRVSYIYYVVILLPGVYVGLARLFSRRHVPWPVSAAFVLVMFASTVALFPLRAWGGP